MIDVRHGEGLFGGSHLRGFLIREEHIGFMDLSCVLGLEVPAQQGEPALIGEFEIRELLVRPTPEVPTQTAYTTHVLGPSR